MVFRKGSNLEQGRDDGPDVLEEFVGKYARQVDVHHDVAVAHVRVDVGALRRRDDVGHQLAQLLQAKPTHHLAQS